MKARHHHRIKLKPIMTRIILDLQKKNYIAAYESSLQFAGNQERDVPTNWAF